VIFAGEGWNIAEQPEVDFCNYN